MRSNNFFFLRQHNYPLYNWYETKTTSRVSYLTKPIIKQPTKHLKPLVPNLMAHTHSSLSRILIFTIATMLVPILKRGKIQNLNPHVATLTRHIKNSSLCTTNSAWYFLPQQLSKFVPISKQTFVTTTSIANISIKQR